MYEVRARVITISKKFIQPYLDHIIWENEDLKAIPYHFKSYKLETMAADWTWLKWTQLPNHLETSLVLLDNESWPNVCRLSCTYNYVFHIIWHVLDPASV